MEHRTAYMFHVNIGQEERSQTVAVNGDIADLSEPIMAPTQPASS